MTMRQRQTVHGCAVPCLCVCRQGQASWTEERSCNLCTMPLSGCISTCSPVQNVNLDRLDCTAVGHCAAMAAAHFQILYYCPCKTWEKFFFHWQLNSNSIDWTAQENWCRKSISMWLHNLKHHIGMCTTPNENLNKHTTNTSPCPTRT